MRIFVDQHQPGRAGEDGVEVHLHQRAGGVGDGHAGNDLEGGEQRLRLGAAMRLDHADDHVDAGAQSFSALAEHLEGLAHAGGGTEEYLELAAILALRLAQQGVGRRPRVGGELCGRGHAAALAQAKRPVDLLRRGMMS